MGTVWTEREEKHRSEVGGRGNLDSGSRKGVVAASVLKMRRSKHDCTENHPEERDSGMLRHGREGEVVF